ncbi:hypothetical protein [Duncaniella muris]|uniref:hypothetical protein n=1 Tax=Duncaniella muris TaxID=2094150 RepID=UPI001057040C
MVDLRAAVAHVVGGEGLVALNVSDSYKSLDSVIFKRGRDFTVRSAMLNRLDSLAASVGEWKTQARMTP